MRTAYPPASGYAQRVNYPRKIKSFPNDHGEWIMTQATAVASITITTTTDLAPWIGMRVCLTRTVRGERAAHYGVFDALWHSDGKWTGVGRHVAGYMTEEPHGDCRGGRTCIDLPLDGQTTLALAPLQP